MSRNGSGTYNLPAGNPVVTGTSISSAWANNTLADLAAAVTQSISQDGQTPIVANMPMSTYKHTNVGLAAVGTDYARADQVQNSTFHYLSSIAGTDTITAAVTSPSPAGLTAGQVFRFVSVGENTTTSVTLNINGLGAKAITKNGANALAVGDISSGMAVEVVYDGTQFQLVNGLLVVTSAASATNVTGTTQTAAITWTNRQAYTGQIISITPGAGTAGAFIVAADPGNTESIVQFVNNSGSAEWGWIITDGSVMKFAVVGTERFRLGSSGQFGIGGANYGNAGQALVSNGASAAPSWSDIPFPNYTAGTWQEGPINTSDCYYSSGSPVEKISLKLKIPRSGTVNFISGGRLDTTATSGRIRVYQNGNLMATHDFNYSAGVDGVGAYHYWTDSITVTAGDYLQVSSIITASPGYGVHCFGNGRVMIGNPVTVVTE